MRALCVVALGVLLTACYHPLEIVGEGDIVSSTGARNCTLEEQPCENWVEGDYNITYSAVPRPGWKFVGWEGCGTQFPECTFDVPGDVVSQFHEMTPIPLRAVFAPEPFNRPNILTIMVDDLGYNDLAINNNNGAIVTPNMDQLAREGVRFTRHYAASVCSPARVAFLTAKNPSRLGYIPNGPGISPDTMTLPDELLQAGYRTWHIGKWHIGDEYRDAWPDRQGFERWFGFLSPFYLAGENEQGEMVLAPERYEDPWLEGDADPGQIYPGHLEDILTDRTLQEITNLEAGESPWYLNLWFFAPHGPVSPSVEFASLYPDTNEGRYRALVEQMDHNIGRIVQHLESIGALEDTIVVVVSDNGGNQYTPGADNNWPYYGYKATLHEGALRVPMIVRWPSGRFAGTVYDGIVAIEDIYPTLLEAVGEAPPDDVDGISFFTGMGTRSLVHDRNLFWEFSPADKSHAVLSADGNWKRYQGGRLWGVDPPPVLFDLAADPTGSSPMSEPPAEQVQQLADIFHAWYREAHTVQYQVSDAGGGVRHLTGQSLLRTPGVGAYTFGVAVDAQYEGQILAQDGVWRIDQSGSTVTVTLGGHTLSGDVNGANTCHSVVIAGYFYRKLRAKNPDPHIDVALFIGGEEKDRLQVEGSILASDPGLATVIGDPLGLQNEKISDPVIFNRRLDDVSEWSLPEFSQELCAVNP